MRITSLYRYPVKSLAGTPADQLEIEPWGPRGDRRWAVVDGSGDKVTAREVPAMLGLTATDGPRGGVRITARDGGSVDVPAPVDGTPVPVNLTRVDHAIDAGATVHEFLSTALGRPVRLVWQDDPRRRTVAANRGGLPGDTLSFADAGPLLLTTEVSLDRLGDWAGTPLSMLRFRPNVVIDGEVPFAEESWTGIRLGGLSFRTTMVCDRCVMTMIDPVTLTKGPEPIRSLARHRRRDGKTWFGIRLAPHTPGTLHLGAPARSTE